VEVAKALGGSFKLVTLALRTVREMTQLPKETNEIHVYTVHTFGHGPTCIFRVGVGLGYDKNYR